MNRLSRQKYALRAKIVKAMAHPTRLFIIDQLMKGERCVCELIEMVGDDPSTISKHLSLMKSAGLLEDEKRGLKVFYKLKYRCLTGYLDCIDRVLTNNSKEYVKFASLDV